MIKPGPYPFYPSSALWTRLEEAITLPTLDKNLKDSFSSHVCIFWDYGELLAKRKDDFYNIYAITLFEICDDDYLGGEAHDLRKKATLQTKLEEIIKPYKCTIISQRIIKIEGHCLQIFMEEARAEFEKIFLLFFMDLSQHKQTGNKYTSKDREGGSREAKEEIDRLTRSRTSLPKRFEDSLASLILFQEVEYQHILREHAKNRRTKSMKTTSEMILLLRNLHNSELKSIQAFQETFFNVINSNLRCLLAKAGDPSVPDKIERVESCKMCGVALRLFLNGRENSEGTPTKAKFSQTKSVLPIISGLPKDGSFYDNDRSFYKDSEPIQHARSDPKDAMPKLEIQAKKYQPSGRKNNEKQQMFLYSKDVVTLESRKHTGNYIEAPIKELAGAKKPMNLSFDSLVRQDRPRDMRPARNLRKMLNGNQEGGMRQNNSMIGNSYRTNYEDINMKASNKSYLDFIAENANQYKNKAPLPRKNILEEFVEPMQIGNSSKATGINKPGKDGHRDSTLDPSSGDNTIQLDQDIEPDSLNLDQQSASNKKVLNPFRMGQNKGGGSPSRLSKGDEEKVSDDIQEKDKKDDNSGLIPQKSILKSPNLRRFHLKEDPYSNSKKAKAANENLNKTMDNNATADGLLFEDNKRVSFVAKQGNWGDRGESPMSDNRRRPKRRVIGEEEAEAAIAKQMNLPSKAYRNLEIRIINEDLEAAEEKKKNFYREKVFRFWKVMETKRKQAILEKEARIAAAKDTGLSVDNGPTEDGDEEDKFTRLMLEHIKKHHQFPKAIVYHDSEAAAEKESYIKRLVQEKPWLDKGFLQWYNLDALKETFPLPVRDILYVRIIVKDVPVYLKGQEKEEFEEELRFIAAKVAPFKDKPQYY